MFGPATIFSWLGSFIGGPLTAITGQLFGFLGKKSDNQGSEFAAMTSADRDQAIELVRAQTALNSTKVTNNAHGAAYFFVWLFGIGPAIHWNAVFLATTFPQLGWVIPAAPSMYADHEGQIALSFFLLAPALPVLNGLATRLRG